MQRAMSCAAKGHLDEEEDILRVLHFKDPANGEIALRLAQICNCNKRHAEALQYLNKLQGDVKFSTDYIQELASTLLALGQKDFARELWGQYSMDIEYVLNNFVARRIFSLDKIDDWLDSHELGGEIRSLCRDFLEAQHATFLRLRPYAFELIPLGNNCFPGNLSSRWGIGNLISSAERRYPFDLGMGPLESILNIVLSEFKDFLSVENIATYMHQLGRECFKLQSPTYFFNHDPCINYNNDPCAFSTQLLEWIINYRNAVKNNNILFFLYSRKITPHELNLLGECLGRCSKKSCALVVEEDDGCALGDDVQRCRTHANIYFAKRVQSDKSLAWHDPRYILSRESYISETAIVEKLCQIVEENFSIKGEYPSDVDYAAIEEARKGVGCLGSNAPAQKFLKDVKARISSFDLAPDAVIGSTVMNCNPFTLGHKYLIEKSSSLVDLLVVFVVEENLSFFEFKDRFQLVQEGANCCKNVCVVPSGKFIISSMTFPSYFRKETEQKEGTDIVHDLRIFSHIIAPALGITKRFVGSEPSCAVTRSYNRQMYKELPSKGIEVIEIPRRETCGIPISASLVRDLLKKGNFKALKKYVPETTYSFLLSHKDRYQALQERP